MEPSVVIELIPGSIPIVGLKNPVGQYILVSSLDHVLTEMQLNNAKHKEGKPEYDEILTYLRKNVCQAKWLDQSSPSSL